MVEDMAGRRVMVIEDEVLVAWLLQDMLESCGCEVVGPVAWVEQALTMIEADSPDAALLDVNLNGEKSFPVADLLFARGVPFAFSSGYGPESLSQRYQGFPMLQKPFHRSELIDRVAGLLRCHVSAAFASK